MTELVEISVQGPPNPNAAKFTLNRTVATQSATYRDAASAEAEWARQRLQIPGVVQVFALNDFVSVNKSPDAEWNVISSQAEQIPRQAFA